MNLKESDIVEFKASFNVDSNAEWLEILKDIVAMANTGGGKIFFGINDDGTISVSDLSRIASIDPADITNKIYKYTNQQFSNFQLEETFIDEHKLFSLVIGPINIPMVFTKVGSYAIEDGKQKTAFSVGTVYFRHGAKSEPGNSDDLRHFLERELARIKSFWLDGIGKIVEAPYTSRIEILSKEVQQSNLPEALPIRIVDDPSAPPYKAFCVDKTHPLRQKEVTNNVNKSLIGKVRISSYNIQCIRRIYNIDDNLKYCYKIKYSSPRFSHDFVSWIVDEYNKNNLFFSKTKDEYDSMMWQKRYNKNNQ